MDKKFLKKKVSLLVLCNINPNSVVSTMRTNIEDRVNDFKKSLPIWLSKDYFKNIILVENSNYKGELFNHLIRESDFKDNIELIIYDGQNFDRKLGKGYGWYDQIDKVINDSNFSKFSKDSEYFVIVTGRYILKNFDKIIFKVKTPFMCNINNNLKFAFSPITFFPKSFIIKYWLPICSKTNDSIGNSMEHLQANAMLKAISDGYDWQLPPEAINYDAISATTNSKYNRYPFHFTINKYYSYLKKFIFEFKR